MSRSRTPANIPPQRNRPPSRLQPLTEASREHQSGARNPASRPHSVSERRAMSAMSGKLAIFSSENTRFSPVHDAVDEGTLADLVTRLYTPDPLRRRTLLDQQQRREKSTRTSYDATQDSHLAHFWARQQLLKAQRREERELKLQRINMLATGHSGDCSTSLPRSRGSRQRASPRKSGKCHERQRGRSGYGTDTPDSDFSRSTSSSLMSSPAWTVHRQSAAGEADRTNLSACSSQEQMDPTTEEKARLRHHSSSSSNASSRSRSPESFRSNSSVASDSHISSSPIHLRSSTSRSHSRSPASSAPSSARGERPTDAGPVQKERAVSFHQSNAPQGLECLPDRCWTAIVSCLNPSEHRNLRLTSTAIAAHVAAAAADVAPSQLGGTNSVASKSSALVPHAECGTGETASAHDEDIHVVVEHIHRRDLTALWMLARPPPAYRAAIARMRLTGVHCDLRWLTRGRDTRPPAGGTVLHIPDDDAGDEASFGSEEFVLSSPRSIIAVMRNGVTVEDLLPQSLHEFYATGKLQGKINHLVDKRFSAHEKRRRALLTKVRRDYTTICGDVSQQHVISVLHAIDPAANPDFPIRHDNMVIADTRKGSTSLTRKLSLIASSAQRRTATARELQFRRQEKFERHLQRNMQLAIDRVHDGMAREKREREKLDEIERKRADELAAHQRRMREKEERMRQVVAEGKARTEYRRQYILDKIAEHEFMWKKKQQEQSFIATVTAEENRMLKEQRRYNMERRERLEEYRKLCTLDRIRRKMDKAWATDNSDKATTKRLHEERELAAARRRQMAKQHADEIIAAQRRGLSVTPSSSNSRRRHRSEQTEATASEMATESNSATCAGP